MIDLGSLTRPEYGAFAGNFAGVVGATTIAGTG
jgi:hypothetical protein